MNILICGSRNFTNYELFKTKVDHFLSKQTNPTIISGAAKGADTLAIRYARKNNLPLITIPANWQLHGLSAGFKRNYELIKIADACIAFSVNDSKGTAHTIQLAKQKGIPLKIIKETI